MSGVSIFKNGARTALTQYLFNEVADVAQQSANRKALQKQLDALAADGTLSSKRAFGSADAAAKEVLNATAGLSKKYRHEVAGSIWKAEDGYHYTLPEIGTFGTANLTIAYTGYHTHVGGGLIFSNQFDNYGFSGGSDADWVAQSGKSLYLGVQFSDGVRIGVCSPDNCPNFGRNGTPPSRIIQ